MVQEMKNALFIAYNVEVDETTITWALRKRGLDNQLANEVTVWSDEDNN